MEIVNIHQAKTHLSQLVDRVAKGEQIIIGKAGKPVAKLTAYQPRREARRPGIWQGKVVIPEDFDRLPELQQAFEGTDE